MRLYYGGYGHHPSGKQYAYWGNNNFRTGQNVVAPVTNKKGRTFNTMFTIMRTSADNSQMSGNEGQRLSQKGIGIKMIRGTDALEDLPTGKVVKESGGTKKDWKQMSDVAYVQNTRARLLDMEV